METTLRKPRLFTVEEYHTMAQAGILREDDRVELIDGQIIAMSPIGSRHANCVDSLTRLFVLRVGDQAIVRVQNPIRLNRHSEPEPDLALLVPKDVYASRHPRPDEVLLVVEVAETSLAFDREVKVPLYARAGVPEVWIVALEDAQVEVYRRPYEGAYAERTSHLHSEELQIDQLPEAGVFTTAELIGP